MTKVFVRLFFEVRAELILIGQMKSLVLINRIGFEMRQIGTVFELLELYAFELLDA